MDHPVRAACPALPQRVRRDRHHVCRIRRHVPHGVGAHHRTALEVRRQGADRVRLGLALVRRTSVADRGPVAIPDPRVDPPALELSPAGRGCEAQDPRPRLYGLAAGRVEERASDDDHDKGAKRGKYFPVPDDFESAITSELLSRLEYQGFANDTFSKMRRRYVEMGGDRSNTRYGWIHTRV